MIRHGVSALLVCAGLIGGAMAQEQNAQSVKELAATGTLRVGVGVGPAASAFWTTRDPATGSPRGVTVDLGTALGQRLRLPVAIVEFKSSGEVTDAADSGAWDVTFMPVDDERRKRVDFGPNYYLSDSTYLVPSGSPIRTIDEVDRPQVRVYGVENTTTIRTARRVLKTTGVTGVRSADEILELLRKGEADAAALGRDSLKGLAAALPGARILDGYFHATGVAVAVPKGRPAALALVTEFIEAAKTDGTVRRALDNAGFRDAAVAPPGSR
jgi:polar amino acid transport system substrate-binding protein